MNIETWNRINSTYVRSYAKEAFKSYVVDQLLNDVPKTSIYVNVDGRRVTTTLAKFVDVLGFDAVVNPVDSGSLIITPNDAFKSLENVVTGSRYSFPSPGFTNIRTLRKLISTMQHRQSAANTSNIGDAMRSFRLDNMDSEHILEIYKDRKNCYFSSWNNHKIVIPIDTYNHYMARIKKASVTDALNDNDNRKEYLDTVGIIDADRLKSLCGADGGLDPSDNSNLFSWINEYNINKAIHRAGEALRQLDEDLTLLKYTEMTLKQRGGSEALSAEYKQSINDLVEKSYGSLKGHAYI